MYDQQIATFPAYCRWWLLRKLLQWHFLWTLAPHILTDVRIGNTIGDKRLFELLQAGIVDWLAVFSVRIFEGIWLGHQVTITTLMLLQGPFRISLWTYGGHVIWAADLCPLRHDLERTLLLRILLRDELCQCLPLLCCLGGSVVVCWRRSLWGHLDDRWRLDLGLGRLAIDPPHLGGQLRPRHGINRRFMGRHTFGTDVHNAKYAFLFGVILTPTIFLSLRRLVFSIRTHLIRIQWILLPPNRVCILLVIELTLLDHGHTALCLLMHILYLP